MDALALLSPEARAAIDRLPPRLRDDAAGEALLALAEGKCPLKAIHAYRKRERRYATTVTTFTDLGPHSQPAIEDLTTDRAAAGHTDDAPSGGRRAGPPRTAA